VTDARHSEEVEALIEQFQASKLRELHLRCNDLEIYLSADPTGSSLESASGSKTTAPPAAAPAPRAGEEARRRTASSVTSVEQDLPAGATIVTAPYLGTFYRAPKPGAPSFVEVGTPVVAGTDLCLVEVMKLFTTLRAEAPGKVHAILARDGELVETAQALFVLVPS
jgi:acetyl-CoA carboxylase biotin carboxyl carrier protein